jgi:hypothetical protein
VGGKWSDSSGNNSRILVLWQGGEGGVLDEVVLHQVLCEESWGFGIGCRGKNGVWGLVLHDVSDVSVAFGEIYEI